MATKMHSRNAVHLNEDEYAFSKAVYKHTTQAHDRGVEVDILKTVGEEEQQIEWGGLTDNDRPIACTNTLIKALDPRWTFDVIGIVPVSP